MSSAETLVAPEMPDFLKRKKEPDYQPPKADIVMPERKLGDPKRRKLGGATLTTKPKVVVPKVAVKERVAAEKPKKALAATPAPVMKVETAAQAMSDATARAIIKGSIIKSKYKEKYKKNGNMSCGDLISEELRAYTFVTKDGRGFVDTGRLKEVALTNSVWKPTYANLNTGQMRMTIGNCLRAKYKNGEKIDIGGAVFEHEYK